MNIDSSWVQTGELGIVFVIVILVSGLIVFVMKQNAKREDKLMELLTQQQQITDKQGDILQNLADYIRSLETALNKRLEAIEARIDDKLRAKKRE
jgi:hypothetical protein